MALALDGSTPTPTSAAGQGASITTGSFTPPANSLLVVFAGMGWTASANSAVMGISDSGSHTWSVIGSAIGQDNNGGGVKGWLTYFAASPGAITVTVTTSGFGTGSGGVFVVPLVFTGAASDQTGAAVATVVSPSGNTGSTSATVSVITTRPGSWVWGISDDSNNNTTWTANGNSVLYNNDSSAPSDGVTMTAFKGASTTGTPGSTVFGGTWGVATATTNTLAFEVLPFIAGKSTVILQAVNTSNYF